MLRFIFVYRIGERARQNKVDSGKDSNKTEKRRGEERKKEQKMSTKIVKTGKIGIFTVFSRWWSRGVGDEIGQK